MDVLLWIAEHLQVTVNRVQKKSEVMVELMKKEACDHVCSSDCRRDGCDKWGCVCGGEWHEES